MQADPPIDPSLPELVLTEGDEEVQYIYIELPSTLSVAPGTTVSLRVRGTSHNPAA